MPGNAIATHHEQFLAAVELEGNRRREGFQRLHPGVGRPDVPPQFLAVGGVQSQEVRFIRAISSAASVDGPVALQHLEVEPSVVQHRAGGESPLEGKITVILLNVSGPHLVPGEVVGQQFAVAEEEINQLAIRHGRGGSIVAPLIARNSHADLMPPDRGAIGAVQAVNQQALGFLVGAGEKHLVAPDDRR